MPDGHTRGSCSAAIAFSQRPGPLVPRVSRPLRLSPTAASNHCGAQRPQHGGPWAASRSDRPRAGPRSGPGPCSPYFAYAADVAPPSADSALVSDVASGPTGWLVVPRSYSRSDHGRQFHHRAARHGTPITPMERGRGARGRGDSRNRHTRTTLSRTDDGLHGQARIVASGCTAGPGSGPNQRGRPKLERCRRNLASRSRRRHPRPPQCAAPRPGVDDKHGARPGRRGARRLHGRALPPSPSTVLPPAIRAQRRRRGLPTPTPAALIRPPPLPGRTHPRRPPPAVALSSGDPAGR